VWTIGHSTRTLAELVALLRAHDVRRVVDVRRFPSSRRHPHFAAATLARALPDAAIAYAHAPGLGGFRRPRPDSPNTGLRHPSFRGYADYMLTDAFAPHLASLLAAAADAPTAIMCAEATPTHCHRSLLADTLTAHRTEVHHILTADRTVPHTLTRGAHIAATHVIYPGQIDLFERRSRHR
jgi:uncharacterized protein (DUF488 family)